MAKVVISGYYGFDNLGDEAVLFSILKTLRELRIGLRIEVLSNNPAQTADVYKVTASNRWKLREVYGALKDADMLISGGGSLLQDVTGLKSLIYYLGVIWLAQLLGKPVFFYAQGIGPVHRPLGRFFMRQIVNRVNFITVRDQSSQQDLQEMKINRPQIEVTADPVLGLEEKYVDKRIGQEILRQTGLDLSIEKRMVGISVRPWQELVEYKKVVAELGDKLSRVGYQVVFLPMHYPDDIKTSQEVAELMEQPAVVLDGHYSVVEMASLISNMDLLVGMRLHALILAAVMDVPPVAISYDPKIDRFMGLLGKTSATPVDKPIFADLWGAVEEVISDPWLVREELLRQIQPLRQSARISASLALKVLDKSFKKDEPAAKYL
ncbi:polysaccharide pyruvyl transferase CsaB [Desulfotomaculum defluvii]